MAQYEKPSTLTDVPTYTTGDTDEDTLVDALKLQHKMNMHLADSVIELRDKVDKLEKLQNDILNRWHQMRMGLEGEEYE